MGFSQQELAGIGTAYVKATPAESSADALISAIQATLRPWPWSAERPLREQVAADFAAGDTVLLNGWLLGRTEARCCALLVAGRPGS